MMSPNRALGALLGLAAGDRNGGPIQMALALAEALIAQTQERNVGTSRAADDEEVTVSALTPSPLNIPDVLDRYLRWWDQGRGVDGWDCGVTANAIFTIHHRASQQQLAPRLRKAEEVIRVSGDWDRSQRGMTAGVNAVHRITPLALAAHISDADLPGLARQESQITHFSPISQACCAVFAVLLRLLTRGSSLDKAVSEVLSREDELCPDMPVIAQALRAALDDKTQEKDLAAGGFAPKTLGAAIYFVHRSSHDSFQSCLYRSIAFAGPANFCPVLVGALAGALFGADAIKEDDYAHCRPGVVDRVRAHAPVLNGLGEKL